MSYPGRLLHKSYYGMENELTTQLVRNPVVQELHNEFVAALCYEYFKGGLTTDNGVPVVH